MRSVRSFSRETHSDVTGRQLITQFRESLDEIQSDKSIRVVVLRSEVAGAFCAGADLKVNGPVSVVLPSAGACYYVPNGSNSVCQYVACHI